MPGASRPKYQVANAIRPTTIAKAGSRPSHPPAASTAVGASGSWRNQYPGLDDDHGERVDHQRVFELVVARFEVDRIEDRVAYMIIWVATDQIIAMSRKRT